MLEHRLRGPTLHGLAHERPAVGVPRHGLQVQNPAEDAAILEVQEPVRAVRGLDPGALMRAVHRGRSLLEHDPLLIRAEGVPGAEGRLPPGRHAARRREDPVPAVALVELGSLERDVAGQRVAVDHRASGARSVGEVRFHGDHGEGVLAARATRCPAVHEIGVAVVIPQRAGIDDAEPGEQGTGFAPRSGRVLSRDHHDPLVDPGVDDVERALMPPDRRGPHAGAVARQAVPLERGECGERMREMRPVHEVVGDQHWQPWRTIEARADHVVPIPDADRVRIGEVGIDDRVAVARRCVDMLCHHDSTLRETGY